MRDGLDAARDTVDAGADAVSSGIAYGNAAVQDTMQRARAGANRVANAGSAACERVAEEGNAAYEQVSGAVEEGAGVARGAWDTAMSDDEELAADPEVQAAILKATAAIPNQDIIYEQLAHNLAYGRADVAQLKSWGYGPPEEVIPLDTTTGMYLVAVRPDPELDAAGREAIEKLHGRPLRSVLAFRGSADAVDWADDVSPEHVGAFQFSAHKGDIAAALGAYADFGPPDTTGHSLGGALAQLAATVGAVSRCVTFQAPGIPAELAASVPEDVEATHHRAKNDAVAWAGEEHLEGDAYIYDTDAFEPGISHPHFLLGGLNDLRGGAVPDVYDGSVYNEPTYDPGATSGVNEAALGGYQGSKLTYVSKDAPDWDADGQTDWYEEMYASGRQRVSEAGRWAAGSGARVGDDACDGVEHATGQDVPGVTKAIGAGGNMVTGGQEMEVDPQQMELYIQLWARIESAAKAGVPLETLYAEIGASGLDTTLQPRMMRQIGLLSKVKS